jgi:hypothetical protein
MIRLEFLTEDENLIALATAYWAMDESGAWMHSKVSALESMFNVPRGRVHQYVRQASVTKSLTPYCSKCGAPATFNSRTDADSFKKRLQRSTHPRFGWNHACTDCVARARTEQQSAREAKQKAHNDLVHQWLRERGRDQQIKDYRSIGLREAFLLNGLLGYAGESWRGKELDSWESHRTQLCGDELDCCNVYEELYQSGWLSPSPNSPFDAFTFDADGTLSCDIGRVRWVLATDQGGAPFEAVLDAAADRLRQAGSAELVPLWRWVSLRELHSHFNYWHKQFNFRSRGWTPTIEGNLARLLEDCSLGVAKTVMHKSFKHLASELQKKKLTAAHVYNMLPGNFQRTLDHWRANGWHIHPWVRRVSTEPIYTSLLFDRVLGGGTDFYNNLTSSRLIEHSPGGAEPDATA